MAAVGGSAAAAQVAAEGQGEEMGTGVQGVVADMRPLQLAGESMREFLEGGMGSFIREKYIKEQLGFGVKFTTDSEGDE
ncbi:hypothetical protein MN608_06623 [Microdochium nivale]|nr:hypothetical protein MN608_06623 [Microdochium nivale]